MKFKPPKMMSLRRESSASRLAWISTLLWMSLTSIPVCAQWVSFNDVGGGPGTHPHATRYDAFGQEDGTNGTLRTIALGYDLPVALTVAKTEGFSVALDTFGGDPAPGTPLFDAFREYVDFSQSGVANNVGFRTGGSVTFTWTGLDPARTYELQLGAVRGGPEPYTNRWTLLELIGADFFTAAHTSGALTSAHVPELEPAQAALAFGRNHTADTGDIAQWVTIAPGSDGSIAVLCTKYVGTVPGGSSNGLAGYAPTAIRLRQAGEAPIVLAPSPPELEVTAGQPAEFVVLAEGYPVFYQWFRDGVPILNATNRKHRIEQTVASDHGSDFFVVASNQFNVVQSEPTRLQLTFLEQLVFGIGQMWRYRVDNQDLGTSWREPDYDHSSWPAGPGPLGIGGNALNPPLQTFLPNNVTSAAYFRTEFDHSMGNGLKVNLTFTNFIDDGAVFYLNGSELVRINMPAGPVLHETLAVGSMDALLARTNAFSVPLLPGRNVLAVEVHQSSTNSSDIVFGASLVSQEIPDDALSILVQPVGFTAVVGDGPREMFAQVEAGSDFQAQWIQDGVALAGETNTTLRFETVGFAQAGTYWLLAATTAGSVSSDRVEVHVVPKSEDRFVLLPLTNAWRFRAQGQALPLNWNRAGYDDLGWPLGIAVFSDWLLGTDFKNTLLPQRTGDVFIQSFYFRTNLDNPFTNDLVNLVLEFYLADGGAFFLNGEELTRVRLPAGISPIPYDTPALQGGYGGQVLEQQFLIRTPLSPGSNVLAAQVHRRPESGFDAHAVLGVRVTAYPSGPEPVRVVQPPADTFVPFGYPLLLDASVFGSFPIRFQWHRDGQPLPGATNRILRIQHAIGADAGTYYLTASNEVNVAQSAAAAVTIGEESDSWIVLTRGPYLQSVTQTSIVVRWRTNIPTPSQVSYGADPGPLNEAITSMGSATEHEVRVEGLEPGLRYGYNIGAVRTNFLADSEASFATLPDADGRVRVWAQGDAGTGLPDARRVADAYLAFTGDTPTDVWLMLGDNAYGSGLDEEYQTALFEMFPDLLRRVPLWPTLGNHETYALPIAGRIPYFDIFTLPTAGESGGVPSSSEHYYAFDYGPVHFVSLDSQLADKDPAGAMYQWLASDLAANQKPWLIAYWHSPPYTKGTHNSDLPTDSLGAMRLMRENFLPLLESHDVDVVLCGHSHVYERSFLLDGHYGVSSTLTDTMLKDPGSGRPWETGAYRKNPTPGSNHQGSVYVVAGSSGWTLDGEPVTLDHPAMVIGMSVVGSMILDIDGPRLDGTFLSLTGEIRDQFTILKSPDAASFRIESTRRLGDAVVIGFKSVAGRSYLLWATPSLDPGEEDWTSVAGPILATGDSTYWTNQMAGAERQFYRAVEDSP